jgi:hypothetical protein
MITSELKLNPYSYSKAGEQIVTPSGKVMPGSYNDTSWLYKKDLEGDCPFPRELVDFILDIILAKDFLIKLISENAFCSLCVQFPGDIHQGVSIPYTILEKIVELKLNFGIEVFPE